MKASWIVDYIESKLKNKTLKTAIILLFGMIFVIIFNIFCATTGLDSFKVHKDTFQKIFALEVIFYCIYTYLGNLLMLWFMEKRESYGRIAIFAVPLSIVVAIVHQTSNVVVGNIVLIFIHFLYRYVKHNKLLSTLGYLTLMAVIQSFFYFLKYEMLGLDFSTIDSNTLRLMLGLDYYIFLYVLIVIKNNIRGKLT